MNDARFGLKNGDLAIIVNVLRQYPEIKTAIIFGSRAKGNYKNGSDIDIALKGNLDFNLISNIKFMLDEETVLPYMFDVLDYATLKNIELKEHIDRVGVVFYEKNKTLTSGERNSPQCGEKLSTMMKQGWEIKKLTEVCEVFEDGDWIESKNQSQSGIRLIQTGNVGNGYFKDREEKARYISEDTFKQLRCTEIFENDCLISRLPDPVGRACLLPKINDRMITAVDCSIVRFNKNLVLNRWFIFYSLSNEYQWQVNSQISGSTRQRISRKNLEEVNLPVPPITEQERIVSILDKAFLVLDQAKANAEKNLKNAKELFDSYLNGIFTNKGEDWEEKKLGEVLEKTEIIDPTKQPTKSFIYLDVSSVNKETKQIEIPAMLLGVDAPSRARKLVKENDIIFATVRPTHGRIALITEEYNEQVCSTGYSVLRSKNFIKNKIIFYFLLTDYFNEQMEILQKGASYPAVTDKEVKNTIISYPKLIEEQEIIVKKFDMLSAKIKQLEAVYQQKIKDLDELKKSILQKVFSGELSYV